MLLVCLSRVSAGGTWALCVLGSREDSASSLPSPHLGHKVRLSRPSWFWSQADSVPRSPSALLTPCDASQTCHAFMLWLSAAVSLNSHGQVPWNSNSLGRGDQTGKITREFFLQFCCSLIVLLAYHRWFTYSKLVHIRLRGCVHTQTEAGSAVNGARVDGLGVSVWCPSSGGFSAKSRGFLRGNVWDASGN